MSENILAELGATRVLSNELKPNEILRIITELRIPEGLYQDIKQGTNFLTVLNKWPRHNAFLFHQSLNSIRPDLIAVACKVKWLCVPSADQVEFREEELSIKTLIELLKSEISIANWELIYMAVTHEAGENVNFEITLKKLLEKGLIGRDLKILKGILIEIEREDLVEKLEQYQNSFCVMEVGEFETKFKHELSTQAKEMAQWESKLKQFAQVQYGTVQQMLGKDKPVSLSEVYIELTILKQEPREINMEDETTYNEIAYLRKIANKEVAITPIDFTEELTSYKLTEEPQIWCMIGNPGCGKTFLAKRTALRFSSNELGGILYSISVPCRHPDWHSMEATRHEEEKKVESEFIQKWLCLGLPIGSSWSVDLAKHLHRTDGEGLLLIIDGLDEFTKKVPFKDTFLCLLLTRQSLIRSTIIVTSRPGAWTDLSSFHELKVSRFYQVLGFSPEMKDLYFQKQIRDVSKLRECKALLARHDEMDQLSLIPVNASLFAALLKGQDSTRINTLTKLYYELTFYMIRRELSRMGLEEVARVPQISFFHADVLACLKRIGFIAFLGVATRELASEENVPLIMGQEEYPSQCLGLAHEHYRTSSVGLVTKVWTFAHLTMQEFAAAHYSSNTSWTKQCLSVRFISHSQANFSLFRMIVRFLCGLVREKAAAVLTIMYRHLPPQPIQLIDMPMGYQLRYTDLYGMSVWYEITEIYFQLIAILYETDSVSIPVWIDSFKQYFPIPIYLYVQQAVSPNEWYCFVQSLKLVSFQLIDIDTEYINATQFNSLMQEMGNCSVSLLALHFASKDSTTVLSYTDIIRDTGPRFDIKIFIELFSCDLIVETAVNLFPTTTNQNISGMRLIDNKYSNIVIQKISNQISAVQCLCVGESRTNYNTLVPALCQATQLTLLHLYRIPIKHLPNLTAALPKFSKLQEIAFVNASLLPAIRNLSNLTYLNIRDDKTKYTTLSPYLLQIINGSRYSLRGMELGYLHRMGLNNWSLLLNSFGVCTNLVRLELLYTNIPSNDVTHWNRAVCTMKSLLS